MSFIRRTPLYDLHLAAGAKMVDFAGWEMPVQYAGLMSEHRAVRSAAGLFDVSHMGEIHVAGAGAAAFVQQITPNDVSKLAPGRIHYSALLTDEGTFVDDLLVYRTAADEFLLVVNASNVDADFAWAQSLAPRGVKLENRSDDYALLALQGPKSVEILRSLTSTPLEPIRYYRFVHGQVAGRRTLLSRTGYTGEDGFELYLSPADAPTVWEALFEVGAAHGLVAAGLGARDTLRLEAAMSLYGHEIDRQTTPWEAGLDWIVKLDKGEFVGRAALVAARERGLTRKVVGYEIAGRGIARQGQRVLAGGHDVGVVTSGTFSPTLEKALGLASVAIGSAEIGTALQIDVRGKAIPARVVQIPFYKRSQ